MKSSPTQKIIAVLVLVFAGAAIVYAAESYRSNPSTTITVNEHTVCKNVINNGSLGRSYFIPTKTSAEWSSFRAADSYLTDISLSDCYTYSWYQSGWGSCSVSCGGGYRTQTVSCKRSDGVIMTDESFCTGTKPETSLECNTQVCPCTDECSFGQGKCVNGTDVEVCGNWDGDSCLEFGGIQSCSVGGTCTAGQIYDYVGNVCQGGSGGSQARPSYVFITNCSVQGDMRSGTGGCPSSGGTGPSAADYICTASANQAGLWGNYKAWISGSYNSDGSNYYSAKDRVYHNTLGYVRTDGVKVADDWNDLIDGTLDNAISVDQYGNLAVGGTNNMIWTSTSYDGTAFSHSTNDIVSGLNSYTYSCQNWTSTLDVGSPWGVYGLPRADCWWSRTGAVPNYCNNWIASSFSTCSLQHRLYCFEN